MNEPIYQALFNEMHPGFFDRPNIRARTSDEAFDEMLLPLDAFDPAAFGLSVPEDVFFGFYTGPMEPLLDAVRRVDPGWPPIFTPERRVYCGFCQDRIASFCIVEDMGAHMLNGKRLRFGGPGCVGTAPEFRRLGIGLKMVCNVTAILRQEGYDISYIHYTGVAPWYAKLGYRTFLRWTRDGFLPE